MQQTSGCYDQFTEITDKLTIICSKKSSELQSKLKKIIFLSQDAFKTNKKLSMSILFQFINEEIPIYSNDPDLKLYYEIWDVMKKLGEM